MRSAAPANDHPPIPSRMPRAVVEVVTGLANTCDVEDLDDLAQCRSAYVSGKCTVGIYKGSVAIGSEGLARVELNPDADPDGYLNGRS